MVSRILDNIQDLNLNLLKNTSNTIKNNKETKLSHLCLEHDWETKKTTNIKFHVSKKTNCKTSRASSTAHAGVAAQEAWKSK